MGVRGTGREAGDYLVSLWPILPFLGLGCCSAWIALLDGTAWLSPVESTGVALVNFSAVFYIVMSVCLIMLGMASRRVRHLLTSDRALLVWGAVGALASLALLLIGPAFFQQDLGRGGFVIFQVAAVTLGASFSFFYLRTGMTFARLPLRRGVVYLGYSYLAAVFCYLAVQVSPAWTPVSGSPSFVSMVIFVSLPLLCACTFAFNASATPWVTGKRAAQTEGVGDKDASEQNRSRTEHPSGGTLRSMLCFAGALLLFAFVQATVSALVTKSAEPSHTLENTDLVMLIRIPLLLLLASLASTLEARRLNFGRLLVGLVSLLEVVIVLGLVAGISSGLFLVAIRVIVFMFEVLTWCMVLAIANCHQPVMAFSIAFNMGAYYLGTGLGMFAGANLAELYDEAVLLSVCAAVLVPCFLLLDGRSIAGLFASGDEADPAASLAVLLGQRLKGSEPHAKGDFKRRLHEYAMAQGLSEREAETLGYLVAGRGDTQIAEAMGISYNTARTHVRNVYNKLNVHDRQTLIDMVNGTLR